MSSVDAVPTPVQLADTATDEQHTPARFRETEPPNVCSGGGRELGNTQGAVRAVAVSLPATAGRKGSIQRVGSASTPRHRLLLGTRGPKDRYTSTIGATTSVDPGAEAREEGHDCVGTADEHRAARCHEDTRLAVRGVGVVATVVPERPDDH